MIIHNIETESDLIPLREKWMCLQKAHDMTVFQTYEWNVLLFRQWNNSKYNRLFSKIVIVEGENVLVPLIVQRISCGFKWLGRKKGIYILGTDSYSDYLNLIYDSNKSDTDSSIRDMLDNIIRTFKIPFYFDRVREDTYTYSWLKKNKYVAYAESVAVDVRFDRITNHEEYTKSLSKSTRQNLRTALNRMKKDGIEFRYEIKKGQLTDNLITEMLTIHLARVMEINKTYNNTLNRISNFFRRIHLKHIELSNNIVTDAMKKMDSAITVLVYCNNVMAGYLFGLQEENKVRIIQNCVKNEYKFYSPMFRGTYDFICESISSGYESVDFTRGGEEYKYKLGGINTRLFSYKLS